MVATATSGAGVPKVYRVTQGLKAKSFYLVEFIGAQGQNRTADTGIFNPLSHRPRQFFSRMRSSGPRDTVSPRKIRQRREPEQGAILETQLIMVPLVLAAIPAAFIWLWNTSMANVLHLRQIRSYQSLRLFLIAGFLSAPVVVIDSTS